MNPTLAVIRSRLAEIAKLRQALDEEERELSIAERVVTRLEAAAPKPSGSALNVSLPKGTTPTQSELIVGTLRSTPNPWVESSAVLHGLILQIHGVDIKSGSLLPLLTNLKNEGTIVRDGARIALAERVARVAVADIEVVTDDRGPGILPSWPKE